MSIDLFAAKATLLVHPTCGGPEGGIPVHLSTVNGR